MPAPAHDAWLRRHASPASPRTAARTVLEEHLAWWRDVAETSPPNHPAHLIVRALESVARDLVRKGG